MEGREHAMEVLLKPEGNSRSCRIRNIVPLR